ncbi:MAG TPA: hypothetical protein DCQ13_04995 [Firmicutes bacterium]|nr:hypothetical protein [Bacillota bacterium]
MNTDLFESYQRSERVLIAASVETVINGVSTHKMRKMTRTLCGMEMSE